MKILEVKNLNTSFFTHLGEVQAVRGNSFSMEKGDILGIVGESGSGKSVTALSIMGLIEHPGKIVSGEIYFNGELISQKSNSEMSNIRGRDISMIFQDPMTSLNPVFTIENLMVEVIMRHQKVSKKVARKIAIDKLKMVGIPEPEKRIFSYPHEFSGGMRQRAMIATALSCNPHLLIADEPTTALDVTIQAQILEILRDLSQEIDTSIIIITHDLGVIAETCNKLIVMYGGMIMETGGVEEIFHSPQHPYTRGLMNSIPKMNVKQKGRLEPIPGSPPDLLNPPKGCPFSTRCPHAMQMCIEEMAPVYKITETQTSACWLLHEDAPEVEGYKRGSERYDG
ncbi:ABC transporter ATP-binding protein [Fusibacter sp. JL298sf-3]